MKEREEKKWNEKNWKEKKAFYQLSSVKKILLLENINRMSK